MANERTKIRRSFFIGLGGTGMRTILYLKKLFIETYGEVPGMIGFLGIDTDKLPRSGFFGNLCLDHKVEYPGSQLLLR